MIIPALALVGISVALYYTYKNFYQSGGRQQFTEEVSSNASDENRVAEPAMSQVSPSLIHLDYDSLYENETESEVESQVHGSLIKHMLSQVNIGMDLSNVVLPTFILERRSLLEMYAEFFAHPEIFVKIADFKTPKDRMIQVVRWYLSSFHVGRKSYVAKKPYNPILGETFFCFWDIEETSGKHEFVKDGPVPWCTQNQLSFVAEQVSHHPPISALYGEHVNKRITFNAHIYTKSKFLGLSICVYNIGKGVISLLDYDEEYIVTFPNGYGRSILTVPWLELGGNVTIKCPKTGYHSKIEFIMKPFYGNKKHKIYGEVFSPDDKKPFLTISGEWNGVMMAKWGEEGPEEFLDVNKLKIVKKQVRPIFQQKENESRRLWRNVTAGLSLNNIEKATEEKHNLEQKQRLEEKERLENNIAWETKYFKKGNVNDWIYIKPLNERLKVKSKLRNLHA